MKFLIKFASFLVCTGILAFGGYQTVMEIRIDDMIADIETALETTPMLPDFGGSEDGGEIGGNNGGESKPGDNETGKPGSGDGDLGGDNGDIGDGDIGGGDENLPGGDNNDSQGGGNAGSGDNNQGGNTGNEGGNAGSGDNNQGGNTGNEGGNAGSGDNNQGGTEPTPPQNETLSSADAQEALGNLYDNSDPEFNDLNREFFVGMIEGFIGGNNNPEPPVDNPENPPVDEPEEEEDFGADFNPDEYNPDDVEPDTEDSQNQVNDLIIDVAGTYFDNLQAGIQQNQQENAGATEEEQQAARDEFIQQESEAFAGLINIATKPEETTEEQLVQSVDAVLNSSVCLDTVTQSIEKNDQLSTTVQDATANMNEETKSEIENKINEALEANPEKEQQYKDLADLFGITLGAGMPSIPEGVNPGDYPGYPGSNN